MGPFRGWGQQHEAPWGAAAPPTPPWPATTACGGPRTAPASISYLTHPNYLRYKIIVSRLLSTTSLAAYPAMRALFPLPVRTLNFLPRRSRAYLVAAGLMGCIMFYLYVLLQQQSSTFTEAATAQNYQAGSLP